MFLHRFRAAGASLIVAMLVVGCTVQPTPVEDSLMPISVEELPPDFIFDAFTIIVCIGAEPDTLYSPNSTMSETKQILQAIGSRGAIPRGYYYLTQVLVNDEFPSFENGGVQIIDNQLIVTFHYKPEIWWSDGTPFTVDDILFTRHILYDPENGLPVGDTFEQAQYEKVDDYTLRVIYPPGIKDPLYYLPPFSGPDDNFSAVILPKHILEILKPDKIAQSEFARRPIPTLGPYEVVEWTPGDNITLRAVDNWLGWKVKTPDLVYRFIPDPNQLLAEVLSYNCDYATSDGLNISQLPLIQQAAAKGLLKYSAIPSPVWEHIDFNTWPIEPGTDNNGIPFFADVRVRQAVALAINKQQMINEAMYGEGPPMTSFLPSDHWAWNGNTEHTYPYDPQKSEALLVEAGWQDSDQDGVLEASSTLSGTYSCGRGEWTIPAGTRFEVDFRTTTDNLMRQQVFNVFQANMQAVGIKVNPAFLPASALFADDGPLNTRKFQIGEFAWVASPDPGMFSVYSGINIYQTPQGYQTADRILADDPDFARRAGIDDMAFRFGNDPLANNLPDGYAFVVSSQIQDAANGYTGSNYSGWCHSEAALTLFKGENEMSPLDRLPHFLRAQELFVEDVPSIPLFQRLLVEVSTPGLCGPEPGPRSYASWNIEEWYLAPDGNCQ